MRIFHSLGRKLGWKLFFSHLTIVLVGSGVLAVVAQNHAPAALLHHLAHMEELLGADTAMAEDLRRNFLAAVNEILLVSGITAALAAVLVSSFVAWRIIVPIRSLMHASKRIAAGNYTDRVEVVWNDELGELAQAFNQAAQALEATEQRRTELIGNVAHELKTPLTSIRGIMEALIDGVLPAETETFLDVQREASRLQRLTEELTELSRAEAGRLSLRFSRTDPLIPAEEAAARLQPQFDDKGIQLVMDCPENLPKVPMDRERIVQVLINLLGNALQYTQQGGVVTFSGHENDNYLIFQVEDTGIGIDAEHLARIFERFYRVEKSRSRSGGGSGIGLTIASHIVQAHGGTLQATSAGVGHGSTFSCALPRHR